MSKCRNGGETTAYRKTTEELRSEQEKELHEICLF